MNLSTVLSPENFEYLTKILLVRNESLVSSNAPFPSMFSSYGNRSLFSLWKDDGSLIKFVKNHFFNGISYILWHVFFFFFFRKKQVLFVKEGNGKEKLAYPCKKQREMKCAVDTACRAHAVDRHFRHWWKYSEIGNKKI